MAELKNIRGNYLAQKLGNFPLDCECLNYAQKRDDISQALGCIGGDRVLLSGFNADGSGLVFVKTNECPWGEVMPVKAGSGSTLHLVSEPVRVDFSAEDVFPQAYFDRYLEYGTVYGAGAENFPISSFWKLRNNKVIYEALQAEMQTREAADNLLRYSVNSLSSSLSSEQSARDTAVRELKEQLLREIRSEVSSASSTAASSLSAEVTALNKRIADLESALSAQIANAQNTADTAAEGLASTQYVNSEISRLSDKIDNGLDDAKTTAQNDLMKRLPRGVITAWYGYTNEIPTGWHLCDGNSGTPDLRGRFILGANNTDSGQTFIAATEAQFQDDDRHLIYLANVHAHDGVSAVQLSIEHLPAHTHEGETSSAGNHTHNVSHQGYFWFGKGGHATGASNKRNTNDDVVDNWGWTSENGNHTHSFTTDATGKGYYHNNMPPFYALCYIMKL